MTAQRSEPGEAAERRPRRPAPEQFVSHWLIFGVGLPLAGTILWTLGHYPRTAHDLLTWTWPADAGAVSLIAGLDMLATCIATGVAVAYGLRVAARHPIVVATFAGSVALSGITLWITATVGWNRYWLIGHLFASGLLAFTWNIPRADAVRTDSRARNGDDAELRDAVGIAKSRPMLAQVERGEFATTIPFKLRGGETVATLQTALPRLEAVTGSLAGRGRVEPTAHADRVDVTVMHTDPFTQWLAWPGLSHPGGSFADPIRTAYYDTGAQQRYHLAADPKANRPRSAILRVGTTGAGKSGDFDIEAAEALSRRDAHVVRIDTAKFMQNTAWALPHLTLGADTLSRARVLEQGMQDLAEYRIGVMGRAGHRDWTPATYQELGLAAWLLQYDEADTVLAELAEWLATKSLSAGIYMSVTIPSADHKSLPTIIRRSLGNRKCFGTGDDYSAGMVLSESTRKNGPDPFEWGARYAGAHLLDRAPGVDPRLFVVAGRTYRAEHAELAAQVDAVRGRRFAAPTPTAGEVEALGEAWVLCQPGRLGGSDEMDFDLGHPASTWKADTRDDAPAPRREQVVVNATNIRKGGTVQGAQVQEVFKTPEYEPKIPDEDRATYNRIDPRQPVPRGDAPSVELDDGVPVSASDEDAAAEFDRVVREMWAEGKREFRNREVLDRCRHWDSVRMTRHLSALDAGKAVQPPGLSVRRREVGRWRISQE